MLLLVLAIVLIGVASHVAMRRYLTGKMDDDLVAAAGQVQQSVTNDSGVRNHVVLLPSEFLVAMPRDLVVEPSDKPWTVIRTQFMSELDEPQLPAKPSDLRDKVGQFMTVKAVDGAPTWRLRVESLPGNHVFVVGEQTRAIDDALQKLLWINIYGGAAVLILAAMIGTELVRRSLRPLSAIEKTAGAIAGGDLTRRVPDPEQGEPVARTEVGSLARSLNSMLAQIETAFTARAASETSARAAESAARDAAVAAQVSENRARRSEEKMRRFVADASHELRTPLTTIRGFAELYRQGAARAPEETAALVKRIEDEAQRMGLLVEDLLLLARMDQERPLRPTPVELRVLAVEAVQGARAMDPHRPIGLVVTPDSGELLVLGDDARLRQVLGNLTSNALAHTPPGTPVELRLGRDGEQAVIEVADEGPGLSEDQRERVFERFYRADAARTRRGDGHVSTGLGLAIVAALVAAHHGTVEVDSEPGKGAVFRVRLPLVDLVDELDEHEPGPLAANSGADRAQT
ncbi:HAMP domain-containing sensor histidine kinase [Catellatospora sp. KI3]|uniref:sensor histidine kinase n=1 Tax=Catellatospora sp. KI3 TaxID=3041620 RepID=UPI0024822579|nr:HAMP domain-containing sensor histidine kinase [Catellatospora sp. KI3]MDI1459765.1 HAMP domain-containing sensor histidine kinase [Catellatospora sp. KI3]